jgi:hypothetical protein
MRLGNSLVNPKKKKKKSKWGEFFNQEFQGITLDYENGKTRSLLKWETLYFKRMGNYFI